MTFSIAAHCTRTGQFAFAVASSSPAVAARCAHARAGVGAVGTQNITDPRLGRQGLSLLALGAAAEDVVRILRASTPHAEFRQLTVVDAHGHTASFSGAHTLGVHAVAEGQGAICAGNLLANHDVPTAMLKAFEANPNAELGERVIVAMRAGLTAGGEAGSIHSAGLLLVDGVAWPVADLRVDWHDAPIDELERLWRVWRPQMEAYVTRALDPTEAPSYGVPGDK